ncbi:MAG: DUF3368 domain-containing protein [Acidobacteria bacterium]|nr:MAG: DUF3368 domain-containing protein [Acidobacteriota bacterium]
MTIGLVVSDTSPIRVLHHLSQLQLLAEFFDEVLIPPAVARELEARSRFASISVAEVPKCRIEMPKDVAAIKQLEAELQRGEAEAIVLAREHDAALLIDERAGRLIARRLGISHTGVLGLLVRAKQKGLISDVLPLVLRARDEVNFFVSDAVVDQVRRLADE